ncbi:hypothetical protein PAHAL_3G460900 [Panicum hallii]|uniref:Uncharacterized protein n=1 Tax=Panicum hallii TaxID=206008 RepID=A0A2T8KLI8_9POAL|nr:hypothetical protein PAHAL_3G460900 [Panicum hallii]
MHVVSQPYRIQNMGATENTEQTRIQPARRQRRNRFAYRPRSISPGKKSTFSPFTS